MSAPAMRTSHIVVYLVPFTSQKGAHPFPYSNLKRRNTFASAGGSTILACFSFPPYCNSRLNC